MRGNEGRSSRLASPSARRGHEDLVGQPERDRVHRRRGGPDGQPATRSHRHPRRRHHDRPGRGAQPARPGYTRASPASPWSATGSACTSPARPRPGRSPRGSRSTTDPWDQPSRLYVRTTTNVVVAGPARRQRRGRRDRAHRGDRRGLRHRAGRPGPTRTTCSRGLRGVRVRRRRGPRRLVHRHPQPQGWPLASERQPHVRAARSRLEPGDYTSAPAASPTTPRAARGSSSPRMQDQNGGRRSSRSSGLEREFMIDILAAHDQDLLNGPARPAPVRPGPSRA